MSSNLAKELALPSRDHDWSGVAGEVVKDFLGQWKLVATCGDGDGDTSQFVSATPEKWSREDLVSDLFAAPTGNEFATFQSGIGWRVEHVHERVRAAVEHAIWCWIEKLNPGFDGFNPDCADSDIIDWVSDEAADVIREAELSTVGDLIDAAEGDTK